MRTKEEIIRALKVVILELENGGQSENLQNYLVTKIEILADILNDDLPIELYDSVNKWLYDI